MSQSKIKWDVEMETFWSPTPIYAYKYYLFDNREELYYGMGRALNIGERYEYQCHLRDGVARSPFNAALYTAVSNPSCGRCGKRDRTPQACNDEWPNQWHGYVCDHCGPVGHAHPTCGFYAYKLTHGRTLGEQVIVSSSVRQQLHHTQHLCLVEMSGSIIEFEKGYKATHNRILYSLELPSVDVFGEYTGMVDVERNVIDPMIDAWQRRYYE